MILIRMLQNLGITPEVAVNGKEAVEMALETPFDVILMDVQMPVMDGLEAARIIRDRIQTEAQPIIIAVTAGAIMGEKEKCIAAGMDDFISKPLKREDIRRMVEVIIEKLKH
jgi:CheY-like chemotaxis protein